MTQTQPDRIYINKISSLKPQVYRGSRFW